MSHTLPIKERLKSLNDLVVECRSKKDGAELRRHMELYSVSLGIMTDIMDESVLIPDGTFDVFDQECRKLAISGMLVAILDTIKKAHDEASPK